MRIEWWGKDGRGHEGNKVKKGEGHKERERIEQEVVLCRGRVGRKTRE